MATTKATKAAAAAQAGTSAAATRPAAQPKSLSKKKASKRKSPSSRSRSKPTKSSIPPNTQSSSLVKAAAATTPFPTLVLDSGGHTVKHGIVIPPGASDLPAPEGASPYADVSKTCSTVPNLTAQPRHQLTILTADETLSIKQQNQLELTRPCERGYITDLGCQARVWNRVLELEGIGRTPSGMTVAGDDFLGGAGQKKKRQRVGKGGAITPPLPPRAHAVNCAVMILQQPFTPRGLMERVDEVLFRDLGFGRVGRRLATCMSAYRYWNGIASKDATLNLGTINQPPLKPAATGDMPAPSSTGDAAARDGAHGFDRTGCCCVIDSGFSLTHVVPTVDCMAVAKAIRRINVGGKLLTNLLKESISYRQWNMMDEFAIVNDAKEKLCFVSTDFTNEMRKARDIRAGCRWFDREFALPDFVESFAGEVRLPSALRREKDREEDEKAVAAAKAERAAAKQEAETKKVPDEGEDGDDSDDDDDSDEETGAQRRRRILRQREEERRRREAEDAERQILSLSVERFAVPEVLFRPSDVGLDQVGLPEAIVQSIELCDPTVRAAMYQNVLLTGGNANIPHFKERLESELRSIAPANYDVRVVLPVDPVRYAWEGARDFLSSSHMGSKTGGGYWVNRAEWEASRREKDQGNIWECMEKEHAEDGLIVI